MNTLPLGFDPQEFFYALHATQSFTDNATSLYWHLCHLTLTTDKATVPTMTRQQLAKETRLSIEEFLVAAKELRSRGLISLWISERPQGYVDWGLTKPTNAFPGLIIPPPVMDLPVSLSARMVLAEIIGLCTVWGTAFTSDAYFSERLLLGKRTVQAAIKELTAVGLLHCDTRQSRTPKRILTPGPRYQAA